MLYILGYGLYLVLKEAVKIDPIIHTNRLEMACFWRPRGYPIKIDPMIDPKMGPSECCPIQI